MVRGGEQYPFTSLLGKDHSLQYIDHLGGIWATYTFTVTVEKIQGNPGDEDIAQAVFLIQQVWIGIGLHCMPSAPFVDQHADLPVRIVLAHDCHVGNKTIFANGATLAGHVVVEDGATIGAFSAVHQFCRVGREAYIGGYSVVTMDALPYGKTVGSRAMARVYGVNTIGLERRGFSAEAVGQLEQAYRLLMRSKLNTSQALERIDSDKRLNVPEVAELVDFIRRSKRGVNLRRPPRQIEQAGVED